MNNLICDGCKWFDKFVWGCIQDFEPNREGNFCKYYEEKKEKE